MNEPATSPIIDRIILPPTQSVMNSTGSDA